MKNFNRRLRIRTELLLRKLHLDTRGHVAVTLTISLTFLMLILPIIVQLGMLANARMVVDHALAVAARSAMTAFPSDPAVENFNGLDVVNRSLWMQLANISPVAGTSPTDDATLVAKSLQTLGVPVTDGYARHITYAAQASTLTWDRVDDNGNSLGDTIMWQPADFAASHGQHVKFTLTYKFYLNIPFARTLIGTIDSVAGLSDKRFITFTSTLTMTTSHGRAAVSNSSTGWPQ